VSDEAWNVRLTAQARSDIRDILNWTAANFGPEQERVSARTVADALFDLGQGPRLVGARARDDIGKGLMTLHVARNKRAGRHFILFRAERREGHPVIEVLRLLHDAMDLAQHIPPDAALDNG